MPRTDVERRTDDEIQVTPVETEPYTFEEMSLGEMVDSITERLVVANDFIRGEDADAPSEDFSDFIEDLEHLVTGLDPVNRILQVGAVDGDPRDVSEYTQVERVYGEEETRFIYETWRHTLRETLFVVSGALDAFSNADGEFENPENARKVLQFVQNLVTPPDEDLPEDSTRLPIPPFLHTRFEQYAQQDTFRGTPEERDARLAQDRLETQEILNHLIWSLELYSEGATPWEAPHSVEVELTPEEVATRQVNERHINEGLSVEKYKAQKKAEVAVLKRTIRQNGDPTVNTWGRNPDGSLPLEVEKKGFLGIRHQERMEAPKTFFMQEQLVRTKVKRGNTEVERLVPVKVSVSGISDIHWRQELRPGESSTDNRPFRAEVRSYDTSANSVVAAQELLWLLDEADVVTTPDGKKYYKVPGQAHGELQWIPYTAEEYSRWKFDLTQTVRNFEAVGLTYMEVKKQQEIYDLVAEMESQNQTQSIETLLTSSEVGLEEGWFNTHLQLMALENSLEDLEENPLLSPDQVEELTDIQGYLRAQYLSFLSIYGRETEYSRIAVEQLLARNLNASDPELLVAEIAAVVSEMERQAILFTRFTNQELETLNFLNADETALGEEEQRGHLFGIRQRFNELFNIEESAVEEPKEIEEPDFEEISALTEEILDELPPEGIDSII